MHGFFKSLGENMNLEEVTRLVDTLDTGIWPI